MKIPFNIKFRPQIESGEYKVETRDGRPARIVCWDRVATEPFDNCTMVALTTGTKSKAESAYYYYRDGHLWNKANGEGDSPLDLFIITPESDNLEGAAENYIAPILDYIDFNDRDIKDAFIAGAEWQKEQDQPITGNSLEQEWLRYVDKKKKEYGGELPSLGEYGWLQIARHFSNWQKEQMMKEAVEGTVHPDDCEIWVNPVGYGYKFNDGDKIHIIIVKEEG